jgi:folate-binding protein YgfZ
VSELRPDFGDVTAEYRAARAGTGFATGTLAILWAEGRDALSFLDGQLSQDLVAMTDGAVGRALLLEPRGKLVAPGWVLRGEDVVGFVVDAQAAGPVLERLASFMFRVDVELRLEEAPVHELWGTAAVETAADAGLDPGPGWRRIGDRTSALLAGGAVDRVIVTGGDEELKSAGAVPIGSVAWSTVRIEAGEPVMGIDVDESTIPQESGLVDASVSFTKGCYVGQELVARIDSRGRVNRRLVGLTMTANVVPPAGSRVVAGGEDRGSVTSVGESLTLRAPVAMAMVRREVEDGAAVRVEWDGGGVDAVVRALPLDDFSDPPHTPRTGAAEGEGAGHEDAT